MSIVGFVPDPEAAGSVVAWVQALADEDETAEYLCYESGFDGRTAQAVREALGEEGEGVSTLTAIEDPMPVQRVLARLRWRVTRLLVTGPFELPATGRKVQTAEALASAAPCQTFALLSGGIVPSQIQKILFVATAGGHDISTLRLVQRLRQGRNIQVTIGVVEDETGAKPEETGRKFIRALLHEEALDGEDFETKVVVDRLKHRGVKSLHEDHDLVVCGANATGRLHPLRQSLGDTAVAIVKRTPLRNKYALADWLPRIHPADYAELSHVLRVGSMWGPDFVAMLALASAIASLGLLQNSPAVVIGSMLLAPLMTPMIGLGLGLGLADVKVMRWCGKSIGLGFLLTLAVSFLIGIITPAGATLSEEVLARGGPNVLDLLIAVFAAAAATYAMARPNISGAIAGVAIATALVPPVCAAGISLAHGVWLNGFGALALFFTNLIAIILMSSLTFSLLGITAARALPRHRRHAQLGRWGLLVLLLGLAGPLSTTLVAQIEKGKNVPIAYPVTRAVGKAVMDRVEQDEGVHIMFIARPRAEDRVVIFVASHIDLPVSYADELREIVRREMDDPELPVNVIAVRGLWRSDADVSQRDSP